MKYHQKLTFLCFTKKQKTCMQRKYQNMCSPFGFLVYNFWYAFFLVKVQPWFINFSISLMENKFFFNVYTSCGYEILLTCTNLPKNKNMKSYNPYLLQKNGYFCLQNSDVPHWHKKRILLLFIDFKHYDLANGKEWVWKIWCIQVSYKNF